MVIVQVDGSDLDLEVERKRLAAQEVRVVWEAKLEDIATLHLHPRDVGAAILSLDVALPAESWRWAGPAWTGGPDPAQAASSKSIVAARLQSSDPAALARRWSQVLDRPVVDADGTPNIPLDGSSVQFVADTDGRGDGLAGMSIQLSERLEPFDLSAPPEHGERGDLAGRDAALSTARARGLPVDGDVVSIAGARFQLL